MMMLVPSSGGMGRVLTDGGMISVLFNLLKNLSRGLTWLGPYSTVYASHSAALFCRFIFATCGSFLFHSSEPNEKPSLWSVEVVNTDIII